MVNKILKKITKAKRKTTNFNEKEKKYKKKKITVKGRLKFIKDSGKS